MKLRHWIALSGLIIFFPGWVFAQTDYSVGTLNTMGTGCTTQNTNDHVAIYATGNGSATFTVQGTFAGTISFFGSGDGGTSWGPLGVIPSSGGAAVQTTTTTGLWQSNVAAYTHICMMMTAYTSGTAFAKIHTSPISARTGGGGTGGGGMVPPGSTGITSFTTTGTTGAATYSAATGALNIPTYLGATSLDSITSAMSSPAALANNNFNIPWNWSLTGAGAGLNLGETAASTGGVLTNLVNNQAVLQLGTASNSTASPLNINQGVETGTVASVPALQVQTSWNNAALVGQGLLISANCIACAATSLPFSIQNGSGTSVFSVNANGGIIMNGGITSSGNFTNSVANASVTTYRVNVATGVNSTNSAANTVFQGGTDGIVGTAIGAGIFKGGDNGSTAATAASGSAILRGGTFTSGLPAAGAMEGTTEVASAYFGTGVAAQGDVVCSTAVQFQVTDCPTGQLNIIGIATGTVANVVVVTYGTVPVRLTAAGTLGHTICMSATTAGQATDSGGTASCPTAGAQIGVIVATAGNVMIGNNNTTATVALSTTLPLVQLHIR